MRPASSGQKVGKRHRASVFAAVGKEFSQPLGTSDAWVHFRQGGIPGVFAAILPAPKVRDLRRAIGKRANILYHLLALLESCRRLFESGFIAANPAHEFPVVVV